MTRRKKRTDQSQPQKNIISQSETFTDFYFISYCLLWSILVVVALEFEVAYNGFSSLNCLVLFNTQRLKLCQSNYSICRLRKMWTKILTVPPTLIPFYDFCEECKIIPVKILLVNKFYLFAFICADQLNKYNLQS